MSSGMSEYWRDRRLFLKEEKIKRHFLDFMTALLKKRPTFSMSMQQMDEFEFVNHGLKEVSNAKT